MKTYGLIGFPLGHSFSARYFAEKFAREGIDAEYLNFEIESADRLTDIVNRHPDLCGLNVTIPHKQAVIGLLDELSDEARAIGAVNVIKIVRHDGEIRLKGFNADIIGFTRSIAPLLRTHHRKALVLGTGGASKAVIHGLQSLHIEPQYVSRKKAAGCLTYEDLTPALMAEYTVIVNCAPCGMYPKVDTCPAIPYDRLTPDHLLYDLVYNPEETLFMKRGKAYGATVKNGLEMLHLQAEASWQFWTQE